MNLSDLHPNQIVYLPVLVLSVDAVGPDGKTRDPYPVKLELPRFYDCDGSRAWLHESAVKLLRAEAI